MQAFRALRITAAPHLARTMGTATRATISDAIRHDHRELETLYDNILAAKDQDTATRWRNQFVWELARHSIGEELVVYPAFEKYLPGGREMADKDRTAHAHVKNALKQVQNMNTQDNEFSPTLRGLMAELKEHIADEEAHDLPALEDALSKAEDKGASAEMAKSFERTKMLVPTKSHPSAPDRPPFETAVGLLTAPFDKIKDIFSKFPKDSTEGKRVPDDAV
jgi:hemerythrin superfamily protein